MQMINNSLKKHLTMKAQINKSQLFKMAHTMLRKAEAANLSEALTKAWKALKLKAAMMAGNVAFAFRKLNGEIRQAVGTLVNVAYTAKNTTRKAGPADVICYFDVEKNAFRSFNAANLI